MSNFVKLSLSDNISTILNLDDVRKISYSKNMLTVVYRNGEVSRWDSDYYDEDKLKAAYTAIINKLNL